MRKAVVGVLLAILVATSLGVGYLAGSGAAHMVTSTSTTTVVSSTTMESTVTSTETSTVLTGVPINASDIASMYALIPERPYELVVNPNDSVVYVTDQFSDNLTTLDLSPFALSTITLPSSSDGIAIDYNTGMVYVGVAGGLEEINTSLVSTPVGGGLRNELKNQVVGVLPVHLQGPLTMDSSTNVIYGTSKNDSIAGVDVLTGAVVANVSLGYPANSIAVDPETGMVFAAGCGEQYPVCNSIASVVNGTSGRVVAILHLNSSQPSTVAVNPSTDLAYVSGDQLVALNGTSGDIVYKVDPLECGAFNQMVVIPYLNEVAAVSSSWSYVLVYDGSTGALVNMYSLPANASFVAFDPTIDQLIVTLWGASLQSPSGLPAGALIAFHLAASRGNVDCALVNGGGGTC